MPESCLLTKGMLWHAYTTQTVNVCSINPAQKISKTVCVQGLFFPHHKETNGQATDGFKIGIQEAIGRWCYEGDAWFEGVGLVDVS